MAKLTSEQRKNLPDDVFGIPEDKAYPMPDEAHVRSAITYFHACPKGKKKELAANINRMAKKYNMKVSLKPHSPFKPYADKEILDESAALVSESLSLNDKVKRILLREGLIPDPNHNDMTIAEFHRAVKNQNKKHVSDALNTAVQKSSEYFLDKEYMLNGGKDRSTIQDFVYDSDLKMCYDITRNFVYGSSATDPEIQKRISMVYDRSLVIGALNEVKKQLKAPWVSNFIDKFNEEVRNNEHDDNLLGVLGTKVGYGEADMVKGFAHYYLNIDNPDFVRTPHTKDSKFQNFTEEEIQKIEDNINIICDIGQMTLQVLCNKFHFPPWKSKVDFEAVIKGMAVKRIIDGFFIAGDNTPISEVPFSFFIKMKKNIYLPIHKWHGKNECVVTAIKIFDNDCHPNYFYATLDEFTRNRYKKLPKMPIRRITMTCRSNEPSSIEESMSYFGINIDSDGNPSLKK